VAVHTHRAEESSYSIIVPGNTLERTRDYLRALQVGKAQVGKFLYDRLQDIDIDEITEFDLLGKLFDTKRPQIFAESAVSGNGSDWNLTELGLLGDISIAAPVTIFDDGKHGSPKTHDPSFPGVLVFTPGALLRNGQGFTPVDWKEVTLSDGRMSMDGYVSLYFRRLLPIFQYINERASQPRSALVTLPGLGCGQFAGPFRGQLGVRLQEVLDRFLSEYGVSFPNIRCVYFDPYSESENFRREIHGISFMVRPLTVSGNQTKAQLCSPVAYEEGDDFSDCSLFSIVAWDHVSWPGNDYYGGSRCTDDGVKAAATSSMSVFTGVNGRYSSELGKYLPPQPFSNWGEVVEDRKISEGLRLWNDQAVYQVIKPK
jgi:hypothetical protein